MVSDKRQRLLHVGLLLIASWITMTTCHEAGHLVGGWLVGAKLVDYSLVPWRLPYSIHAPDPMPLVTLWSGPMLGVLVPLVFAILFRHRWVWFIADFCILANGVYLALSWISGDRHLDTARLLNAGTHAAWLVIYCGITIAAGYVRFRSDCKQMLSSAGHHPNHTNSAEGGS